MPPIRLHRERASLCLINSSDKAAIIAPLFRSIRRAPYRAPVYPKITPFSLPLILPLIYRRFYRYFDCRETVDFSGFLKFTVKTVKISRNLFIYYIYAPYRHFLYDLLSIFIFSLNNRMKLTVLTVKVEKPRIFKAFRLLVLTVILTVD